MRRRMRTKIAVTSSAWWADDREASRVVGETGCTRSGKSSAQGQPALASAHARVRDRWLGVRRRSPHRGARLQWPLRRRARALRRLRLARRALRRAPRAGGPRDARARSARRRRCGRPLRGAGGGVGDARAVLVGERDGDGAHAPRRAGGRRSPLRPHRDGGGVLRREGPGRDRRERSVPDAPSLSLLRDEGGSRAARARGECGGLRDDLDPPALRVGASRHVRAPGGAEDGERGPLRVARWRTRADVDDAREQRRPRDRAGADEGRPGTRVLRRGRRAFAPFASFSRRSPRPPE